jgi:hypothetical protein
MKPFSPLLRRTAALTLLVAAALGFYAISFGPFFAAYSGNLTAIAQLQSAVDKYRQMAARLPAMEQALGALQSVQAGRQGYLDGANDAVAAAILQDRLKSLAAREGGRLQSTQAMPQANAEGKPRRVGVRTHMVLRIEELQRVIYSLETGLPTLFIENLSIRSVAAGATEYGLLDVNFDVIGYLPETRP